MKKFLAILILIFTLQNPSWADDIRDFQIEGMSIGDSALDYFSEKDIKKNSKNQYKKKDFTHVENNNYSFFKTYYALDINFKTGDPEYIIQGLSGIIDYRNKSMVKCKKQLKKNFNEISLLLPKFKKSTIRTVPMPDDPSGKSTDTWAGFFSDQGSVTIGCLDYSDERPNKMDHLDVTIRTNEFNNFLRTAYE
jgi:hypothetical protein